MKAKDIFLLVIICFIWGAFFVLSKFALAHFPPLFLAFLRFFFVFIITSPYIFGKNPQKVNILKMSIILVFNIIFINYALHFSVNIGELILINELVVPITILLGVFVLKEKLKKYQLYSIILAFLGAVLVLKLPQEKDIELVAVILILLATCLFAVYNMMTKKIIHSNPLSNLSWLSLFSFPPFLITSLISEEWPKISLISKNDIFVIIYLVLFCTIFAYFLWFKLLQSYPLTRIAPFLHLSSIFGLVLSSIILEEAIYFNIILGGAMIIIALSYMEIRYYYDKNIK